MTQEQATKILAILTAAYPHSYKNMTVEEADGVVAVWMIQFADVPADIVLMAVNRAISTCKFPPSICEVKEKIRSLYWDSYTALNAYPEDILDEQTKAEYRRIMEITRDYKIGKPELNLDRLLMKETKKFLLEEQKG